MIPSKSRGVIEFRTLFFIISFIFSIIVIPGIIYWSIEQALEARTLALIESSKDTLSANVDHIAERYEARTQDWTSDAHIRSEVSEIASTTSIERAQSLGVYIAANKLPLEPDIVVADVIDRNNNIIASTLPARIGTQIASEHVTQVRQALSLAFGKSTTGGIMSESEIGGMKGELVIAAPIYTPDALKVPAVLLTHIPESEVVNRLGKDTGVIIRRHLINNNGDDVIVHGSTNATNYRNTPPVSNCIKSSKGFSGKYLDDNWHEHIAASSCETERNWTVLVEADSADRSTIVIVLIIILTAGVYSLVTYLTTRRMYK